MRLCIIMFGRSIKGSNNLKLLCCFNINTDTNHMKDVVRCFQTLGDMKKFLFSLFHR